MYSCFLFLCFSFNSFPILYSLALRSWWRCVSFSGLLLSTLSMVLELLELGLPGRLGLSGRWER
ncbi:hypothetical protein EX30DRAFT_266230 [Ascodesmis nigricans]|uniref:Uncharacterized protein n=1 Tax=Ascodesmis nigricans TaxID=341454 RepID=A0A4S2MPH0_9PEZI|nr:hypothetical protein EX30DRAFT_266230 [Ascodesmis nigricans]